MDFTKEKCRDFIEKLGSKDPVPGGGGASALVGAVGMALGNMVGSLTVGKKKYKEVEADIFRLKGKATELETELICLVEKDAVAFEPLSKAYGMKAETEEEIKEKEVIMEKCLRMAASVPFEIMEKCCQSIELQNEFFEKGSKLALSDVGVGVILSKAALQGASLNIFVNTGLMKDRDYAEKLETEANYLLDKYTKMADEIFQRVKDVL